MEKIESYFHEEFYVWWLLFHIFCFLAINSLIEKTFFQYWQTDAFYNQMYYVAVRMWDGETLDLFFRFVVAFPFFVGWLAKYPAVFDSAIFLPFILPILLARFGSRPRSLWQPFLIYLPYLFSFRAVLAMCGIAYLFVYFYSYSKRSKPLMFVSMFLANLSSGVVLLWLALVFLIMRRISAKSINAFLAMFFVMGLCFAASFVEKYGSFGVWADRWKAEVSPVTEAANQENSIFDIFEGIFSRNTLVYSLADGDWPRFVFYTALLIAIIVLIGYAGRCPEIPKDMRWFFMASIPFFLLEGLGAVSILICVLLFYINFFNPRGRQELENKIRKWFLPAGQNVTVSDP